MRFEQLLLVPVLKLSIFFCWQAEGHSNLNLGTIDFQDLGERISNSACESSLSPALYHESSAKPQGGLQRYDTKPIVDNESDDSDSGMFRVKRPSALKAERRNVNKVLSSKNSEQQVCKIFGR